MKRMWQNWLAMIALVAMAGSANAQIGINQPSQIGSYQSILSRAGYGSAMGMQMQPGVPMQGSVLEGGNMAQGSGTYGVPQSAGAYGMQHAAVSSGAVQSAPIHTAPVVSGAVQAAPMTSGQIMAAPMAAPMVGDAMSVGAGCAAPMAGGAACGTSYGDPMGGGMVSSYVSAPVYSTPVYEQSVVAPVYSGGQARQRSANYTLGLIGMFFQRDYEDNRYLGFNPAGDTLFTNDADEQTFDGYGINLTRRNCSGGGLEVVYWALNPGRAVATLTGANVATAITGLDQLNHVPSGRDVYDIYANTTSQTITRDTDINNLEFNFLRNGGTFCTPRCKQGFYEMLGGFRWFEFDETLQYGATIDTAVYPVTPAEFNYRVDARNRLLGFQLGARNEFCFGSKLRFFSGIKGGIFNNNIRTRQSITDIAGQYAQVGSGPAAGRDFDYTDEKNDVAFLGELDFGILYHLSCRTRLRLGYRVLGVSGVALAADQFPYLYNDPVELSSAQSNGRLLLNGGYYGIEFCF